MKGYVADAKAGKVRRVDDGKPFPEYPPYEEPEGVDLEEVRELIKVAKERGWIPKVKPEPVRR